ncbi:MAG: hypothetical protein HYU29_07290 [Chloroflexi bacterium]|nr:hypothetical protein [Chloroflexota bacterium]
MTRALRALLRMMGESGQVMAMTVMMVGLGAMATGASMATVVAVTRGSSGVAEDMGVYYAAASGIEAVMADLLEGLDPLGPSYRVPEVLVNGIQPTIVVGTPPSRDAFPRSTYRYLNPGVAGPLSAPLPGQVHRVRLINVEPFSLLFVNWSFSSPEEEGEVKVLDSQGHELAEEDADDGDPLTMAVRLTSDDTYIVEFKNDENLSIVSSPFSDTGGSDKTWIYAKMKGREYVVTSRAQAVDKSPIVLRAYLRQLPGAHPDNGSIRHTVVVEAWQRVESLGATP